MSRPVEVYVVIGRKMVLQGVIITGKASTKQSTTRQPSAKHTNYEPAPQPALTSKMACGLRARRRRY